MHIKNDSSDRMKKAYIYPVSGRSRQSTENPYLNQFIQTFSSSYRFVNADSPSKVGILNLAQHINKIDLLFLHWIENLPDRNGGYLQSLIFVILCWFCKARGTKVIWTLHNKRSHIRKHAFLKRLLYRYMATRSDFIITHSSEGVKHAISLGARRANVRFFHHPITDRLESIPRSKKSIDVLIWGRIEPYKGIEEFLKHVMTKCIESRLQILVIGKASEPEYIERLKKYESANIRIEYRFIGYEELGELIARTRVVLFTHKNYSVLSSGALMDSISYGASVVGPDTGAFRDLKERGIIRTFIDYRNLIKILNEEVGQRGSESQVRLREFIASNSWREFGDRVSAWIDN